MVPAETRRRAAAGRRAVQSERRPGQPLHGGRSGGRHTGGGIRVRHRRPRRRAAQHVAAAAAAVPVIGRRRRAVHGAGPGADAGLPQRRLRVRPAQQRILLGHVRADRPIPS